MNRKQTGRPVDLSGINMQEVLDWFNSNKLAKKIIICQVIIALNKGVKMTEVCHVLGVTREGVRLWKNRLRKDGLRGLIKDKRVGKRSKLTKEKLIELKNIIKNPPVKIGYNKSTWTGLLIKDYVKNTWGIEISLRTSQLWLSKVK